MPRHASRVTRYAVVGLVAAGLAADGDVMNAGAQAARVVAVADTSALTASGRLPDILARRITIELRDVSIEAALRVIAERCDLRFSYSSDVVPVSRRISISRADARVGDVLLDILRDTDIEYVVTPSGYVVLVRIPAERMARVTPPVPPEERVTPSTVPTVPLRPQVMDRVIVMGTPVSGAPERELASAVTVLTASQIASFGAASMEDLLRTAIPGVVAWDLGINGPLAQLASVRGSSSFTANYFKTYVDGVELASPYMLFAIDPYSIERIEIIRGPQGSALYGSDAISGVVQVVTRRGSPAAHWHPQGDGLFSGGVMESRYVGGASGDQRHSAMLSTGGGMTSLGIGGTYASAGAVAPGGHASTRGTFGGFRHTTGPLHVEGTLRYADIQFTAPENPLFRGQVLPASLRPPVEDQHIQNETYGATFDLQPAPDWRQTLVVGIDRNAGAIPQQREPATVADALLGATRERVSKTSLRYSTVLHLFDVGGNTGALTLGAERSGLVRERLGLQSDLAGAGTGLSALYHDDIRNTGLFGQLKLDVVRSLFVTTGLRAERNSTFGARFGTAWSPMLGAAYTRDVGPTTAKIRVAYGKGIRPPAPSARQAISTVTYRQVENPLLEPESQSGVESGVELYRGDRFSLAITGYAQHADGLIQEVLVNRSTERAIQYQNVGRIRNQGLEMEGSVRAGSVRGALSFAITDSRVRALSGTYSGDLAVGDRVPEVPGSSGLASVSWIRTRTQLTAGASYIGAWTGYDWVAFVNGELGNTTPQPSLRSYLRGYPALLKPFFSVSRPLHSGMEWFGRVDNLTNLQRNERDDLQITPGRTWTVGLRIAKQ
jgi:outer membrane receptor protein involved in Fe transport